MNWESDARYSSGRPTTHRNSREASAFLSSEFENDEISLDEALEYSIGLSDTVTGISQSPRHNNPIVNRSGGWASEEIKSSKRRAIPSTLGQRFQSANLTRSSFESDDDIPNIPELDEYDDYRPLSEYKPSAPVYQVATYEELEAATPHYLKVDDINLHVLTKCLCIDDGQHIDEDKIMSWDTLFTDVASYLIASERNDEQNADSRPTTGTSDVPDSDG